MRRALDLPLRVVSALALLHALWRLADKAQAYLTSPWSRDYGEGCVLAMVQLLAEHGSYFPDMRGYPIVHGNYPPLFIALNWPAYVLLGPTLWFPRLLSLLATLGLVAALYRLLRLLSGTRVRAATLALAFVAPWFVQTWAPLGRVDMLACLLSVLGLLRWQQDREQAGWRRYRAFPLFWLAFFTKQNALLAPAAVLLDLWLTDRRRFRPALAAFGLPLAGLFGLLVALTGGEAWRHLVSYTAAAEYEWPRMLESYGEYALVAGPALLLIATGLSWARSRALQGAGRCFAIYALLNLLALATIAKAGAAQNYFIEPWLATLLLCGVCLRALEPDVTRPLAWGPAALLVLVLVACGARSSANRLPQAIRHPERAKEFASLTEIVRATQGPILSENLSLLVLNRRPVLVEPFGYLQLTRKGLLPRPGAEAAAVLRDCERGYFALVISEHRLHEVPGLGACLDARYEPVDLGPYQALRPRPPRTGRE